MARINLENSLLTDCIVLREKRAISAMTLTGTLTMSGNEPNEIYLNPNAGNRSVLLPAVSRGGNYTFFNTGADGSTLAIKNAAGTITYATIGSGDSVSMRSDGTSWFLGGTRRVTGLKTAVSDATAGNITVTAAMILAGILVRSTTGASRVDTWSTAALLVAAIPGVAVGDVIEFDVINNAAAAETITTTAGVGMTFGAAARTHIIAQNACQSYWIRFTNVTLASEAYVVYEK